MTSTTLCLRNAVRATVLAMLIAGLAGCASIAHRMESLEPGMSRAEVLKIMGSPDSRALVAGGYSPTEILVYDSLPFGGHPATYWVRLVGGRVDFFGQPGDFGSAQAPPSRMQIDSNTQLTVERK